MPDTVPDPKLTREEAEHLSERCTESTNAPKVNGYSCETCRAIDAKLRTALFQAPGGEEERREYWIELAREWAARTASGQIGRPEATQISAVFNEIADFLAATPSGGDGEEGR